MSTRSIRSQPFCWQEKSINRLLRDVFKKLELSKMLLLYQTITEIDSDFNGKKINYYTKTISTYSGLDRAFIPKGLKKLENLNIIEISEEKDSKSRKFIKKTIIFTPEKIDKSVNGKTVDGKTVAGNTAHKKIIKKENNTEKKTPTESADALTTKKSSEDPTKDLLEKIMGNNINEVIGEFYEADKGLSGGSGFGRKTYRDASEFLIKEHGLKNTLDLVRFAIAVRDKPYAPVITNPTELKEKLVKLKSYVEKEKGKSGKIFWGSDFSK